MLPKIVFVIEFIYWPVILTRFMSGRIFCLMSCPIVHWLAPGHRAVLHQPLLDGSDEMSSCSDEF